MLILKEWLKSLLSVFVFLRYRSPMELYEKLMREKRTGGLLATVFVHYMERHGGFIGLGASFAGRPYFPHGFHGVFISEQSVIGRNAVIFQDVTIGSVHTAGSRREGSPVIGDDCYIGAGAKIIGGIRIGNGCRIGANAVVYEDMPDHSVALCAPTRIVVRDAPMDNRFYAVEPDGTRLCWQDGALRRAEPTAPGRGESAT